MPPRKLTPQEEARAKFNYYREHPEANQSRQGNAGGGSGTQTRSSQPAKNMPGPQGTEDADGWLSGIFNKIRKNMGG